MVVASCAYTHNDREQSIYSPNYPSSYEHYKPGVCTWKLTAPEGRQLKLSAFGYEIEGPYDFLNIYDGPNTRFYNRKYQFDGTSRSAAIIESTGNTLFLKFRSHGVVDWGESQRRSKSKFKIKFSLKGMISFTLISNYYYNRPESYVGFPPFLTFLDGFSCTSFHCSRTDYLEGLDWGYYSKSNGDCSTCKQHCSDDINCDSIECGNNYCSWWKKGKCTSEQSDHASTAHVFCLRDSAGIFKK